jgi:hypothetical protein
MKPNYSYTHCALMVSHFELMIDLAKDERTRKERIDLLIYWQFELSKHKI